MKSYKSDYVYLWRVHSLPSHPSTSRTATTLESLRSILWSWKSSQKSMLVPQSSVYWEVIENKWLIKKKKKKSSSLYLRHPVQYCASPDQDCIRLKVDKFLYTGFLLWLEWVLTIPRSCDRSITNADQLLIRDCHFIDGLPQTSTHLCCFWTDRNSFQAVYTYFLRLQEQIFVALSSSLTDFHWFLEQQFSYDSCGRF